jgi:NADPH-dependent glutamate synthase beta subunit-like oxidoreductase
MPGLYVAGWAKRGPVGIIDSTLRDTMETIKIMSNHMENNFLPEKKSTVEDILNILPKGQKIVTYEDWSKIDNIERERGK